MPKPKVVFTPAEQDVIKHIKQFERLADAIEKAIKNQRELLRAQHLNTFELMTNSASNVISRITRKSFDDFVKHGHDTHMFDIHLTDGSPKGIIKNAHDLRTRFLSLNTEIDIILAERITRFANNDVLEL